VTKGLPATFRLLTKTKNEAAVALLIPALDSSNVTIQDEALKALLDRHSVAGQREIVRRLHEANPRWEAIIEDRHGRMTAALRDAALATDVQFCKNGCRAALWFSEYDLMPALINAAEEESNPNRRLVSETLLKLSELLYDELAAPRDYRNRRDPQLVRQHVLASLEQSVLRFSMHRVDEVIEAFLLLVHRDNTTLREILADPLNPGYRPIVEVLTQSHRPGIIRLLLSFLDDARAPSAAITILARRGDERFVESLTRKIGSEPSPAVAANLRRIDSLAWLQSEPVLLEKLDAAAQVGAVQLAVRSSMSRRAVFKMIEFLMTMGTDGGRRAASLALAQFNGAEANALALRGLADRDPQVQANVLVQLRQRGIPGALARLVEMLDSPHDIVRRAVRETLSEFNFKRFLSAFEMLDDEVRRSTGAMVKRIDLDAIPNLRQELSAKSRTRRLRGIAAATAMNAVPDLEVDLIQRLTDEDHLVRAEVARALRACNTAATIAALEVARSDRSLVVREAAEESLDRLCSGVSKVSRTDADLNCPNEAAWLAGKSIAPPTAPGIAPIRTNPMPEAPR
jgi:HEAT repeat protein